jgi:hypothetical protein
VVAVVASAVEAPVAATRVVAAVVVAVAERDAHPTTNLH